MWVTYFRCGHICPNLTRIQQDQKLTNGSTYQEIWLVILVKCPRVAADPICLLHSVIVFNHVIFIVWYVMGLIADDETNINETYKIAKKILVIFFYQLRPWVYFYYVQLASDALLWRHTLFFNLNYIRSHVCGLPCFLYER
jgi:hypothetical protein